jgi:hypothetical protein
LARLSATHGAAASLGTPFGALLCNPRRCCHLPCKPRRRCHRRYHEQLVSRRIGFSLFNEGHIWITFRNMGLVCLLVAVGLRVSVWIGAQADDFDGGTADTLLDGVQLAISLNGLFFVMVFLPVLAQFSRSLGSLVIIIENMAYDFVLFFVVLVVVIVAFSLLFFGLGAIGLIRGPTLANGGHDLSAPTGPLSLPFMAFFGELPLDTDNAVGGGGWASSICLYTFALIANVGLVNLLIAMFSETYSEFSAKSESEYAYRKVAATRATLSARLVCTHASCAPNLVWASSCVLPCRWCYFTSKGTSRCPSHRPLACRSRCGAF